MVVLCAHLNLLHKDRLRQYRAIVDYIGEAIDDDTPLILAGDFNDWSKKASPALARLGLVEVFEALHGDNPATFPAKLPVLCLDRIYIKNLRPQSAVVYKGQPWADLSDHLPIGVRLRP